MTRPVEFLDLDDLLALATRPLGDPPPVRDVGLLGSAIARPRTTVGGQDAYPTSWLKAAALLQSIVNNHVLVDGNKRLGWLATAVFLGASFRLLGERRPRSLVIVPLAIALVLLVLLRGALDVYLPEPLLDLALRALRQAP